MVYNQGLEARTAADNIRSGASRFRTMEEHENPFLRITEHDISEANQLSLSCPICGNAVENHTDGAALVPVVCDKCGTLYHRACWEQSGGKCAVLGCGSDKFHVYGKNTKPVLKVKYTDLPASPDARRDEGSRRASFTRSGAARSIGGEEPCHELESSRPARWRWRSPWSESPRPALPATR